MLKIAKCESSLRPDAIGDHGTSIGVMQIHLPAHPSVTKEQMLDPEQNIAEAKRIYDKSGYLAWTCARIIGIVR